MLLTQFQSENVYYREGKKKEKKKVPEEKVRGWGGGGTVGDVYLMF